MANKSASASLRAFANLIERKGLLGSDIEEGELLYVMRKGAEELDEALKALEGLASLIAIDHPDIEHTHGKRYAAKCRLALKVLKRGD